MLRILAVTTLALAACSPMPSVIVDGKAFGSHAEEFLQQPSNQLRRIAPLLRVDPSVTDEPVTIELKGEEGSWVTYRPRSLLVSAIERLSRVRSVEEAQGEVLVKLVWLTASMQPGGGGDRNPFVKVALSFDATQGPQTPVECLVTARIGPDAYWADSENRWRLPCVLRGGDSQFLPSEEAKVRSVNEAINDAILVTLWRGLRDLEADAGVPRP